MFGYQPEYHSKESNYPIIFSRDSSSCCILNQKRPFLLFTVETFHLESEQLIQELVADEGSHE